MLFSDEELLAKVPRRDMRAVARLITLVENRVPRARPIQAKLFERTGRAHVIGVTGSPGAGKSTLVDQIALEFRKLGKSVAILAVDPTSPFTGGAVLGDRIRMALAAEDEGIFIRSMATRGALGGISRATLDAIQILDVAGFDIILVETVGVGQSEVDIVRTAHTCLVVLVPGMGDTVQAIKAGILEIADAFVINKADRDGADLLQRDLRMLVSLSEPEEGAWEPPILRTIATKGEGVTDLVQKSILHKNWLDNSNKGEERKLAMVKDQIVNLAHDIIEERIHFERSSELADAATKCRARELDPFTAAKNLIR
jgi:LAO/AO transport system kinase